MKYIEFIKREMYVQGVSMDDMGSHIGKSRITVWRYLNEKSAVKREILVKMLFLLGFEMVDEVQKIAKNEN
jgi:transcriptional regulator with XRE-family HTH domain